MIDNDQLERILSEELSNVWTLLSPEEKTLFKNNFVIREYKKNRIIYAENDTPEYLWCLLKGKVKVYKDGMGGRQQILRLYRPIEFFGYRAYFAQESYASSAAAFELSVIGSIKMSVVKELIMRNKDVAWFFIQALATHLGGSDRKIVNLTQKHIRGRLAESLCILIDQYGYEADNETINIYMSREDIANLSNMTTSNAIRTLTTFANERLIAVDGRRIKIVDEQALRSISKFG